MIRRYNRYQLFRAALYQRRCPMISPSTALHDPVFRVYTIFAASLLTASEAVLAIMGRCLKKDLSSVWKTYRSWWIMVPVYVVALLIRVPIISNRTKGQVQSLALSIMSFIYIGWMFRHFENGCVYVHCKIGYSRSAAVVMAWLIRSGRASSTDDAAHSSVGGDSGFGLC